VEIIFHISINRLGGGRQEMSLAVDSLQITAKAANPAAAVRPSGGSFHGGNRRFGRVVRRPAKPPGLHGVVVIARRNSAAGAANPVLHRASPRRSRPVAGPAKPLASAARLG
jgi:hypothetical protein